MASISALPRRRVGEALPPDPPGGLLASSDGCRGLAQSIVGDLVVRSAHDAAVFPSGYLYVNVDAVHQGAGACPRYVFLALLTIVGEQVHSLVWSP